MPKNSKTVAASELSQIASGEVFELLCADLLKRSGLQVVRQPSRGSDRGADMIAVTATTDQIGFRHDVRIMVECKHFAASGRSVREANVGNIVERTLSHNCDRYLLITSTIASTTLMHQIEGINNNPSLPIRADVWNGTDVTERLQNFPELKSKYITSNKKPIPNEQAVSDGVQTIAVHLHPDFQDELLGLLSAWNETQARMTFVPVRPIRELESHLLDESAELEAGQAVRLAYELRATSGFQPQDGIVQFCEGRLFDDEHHQFFSVTLPQSTRPEIDNATISLRMMRVLSGDDAAARASAPVFRMIAQQLLYDLSIGVGLQSHAVTRGCVMDYCNDMADINIGMNFGPKYCPGCSQYLTTNGGSHLDSLAKATREFMNIDRDTKIAKRMQLRQERANEREAHYQVAISFAGEDRDKARTLAKELACRNISVFYDGFEKNSLWGKDLFAYLSDLYRFRATYCVMFRSRHYARKLWTNHERKAAQARAFEDNRTYILPIKLDDTDIPGVLSTTGYLRWEDEDPSSIADLIASRF